KNPPCNENFYDYWGMFKSDFVNSGVENLKRRPSRISQRSTDVWSLRQVKNSIGSITEITYESHTYKDPVRNRFSSIQFDFFEHISANNFSAIGASPGINLSDFYKVGDALDAVFFSQVKYTSSSPTTY